MSAGSQEQQHGLLLELLELLQLPLGLWRSTNESKSALQDRFEHHTASLMGNLDKATDAGLFPHALQHGELCSDGRHLHLAQPYR